MSGPGTVTVRLKAGRERPVLRGHPWLFSGAIESIEGDAQIGSVAEVTAFDGTWLARGLLNPGAALRVRIYTRDPSQPLEAAFFRKRLDEALALRKQLFGGWEESTNAWRLVFSESDGLSGLIVDRYAEVLSVQVSAAALVPHLSPLLEHLADTTRCSIWIRAEEDAVQREALNSAALVSPCPPRHPRVQIRENGLSFLVDVAAGQKTGFFLDQRDNRARVARYAKGRRVLSAYCYTGAFEVYAAMAGATSITGLDRSESALEMAREQHRLNHLTLPVEYRQAHVPEALRRCRDAGEHFDLIILDPPRFVASRAQLEKGLRAYKDVNLLALKLLAPGGLLATFSCSGLVSTEAFQTMLSWAEKDTQRRLRILERFSQSPDHPILTGFQESDYLKGFLVYVD